MINAKFRTAVIWCGELEILLGFTGVTMSHICLEYFVVTFLYNFRRK